MDFVTIARAAYLEGQLARCFAQQGIEPPLGEDGMWEAWTRPFVAAYLGGVPPPNGSQLWSSHGEVRALAQLIHAARRDPTIATVLDLGGLSAAYAWAGRRAP